MDDHDIFPHVAVRGVSAGSTGSAGGDDDAETLVDEAVSQVGVNVIRAHELEVSSKVGAGSYGESSQLRIRHACLCNALTQHRLSPGDVHKGTWRCTTVAVKILKVLSHDNGSHQWQ